MIRWVLVCFVCLSTVLEARERFGYISYSTGNLGDDIQAIAAKQFLPEDAIGIDRDFMGVFRSKQRVNTILNGWLMHTKEAAWYRMDVLPPNRFWPPASPIRPLLISIHIYEAFKPLAFSPKSIAYLKKYGPVGARDYATLAELQCHGIPAYFSGCLTLTLQNEGTVREDVIYVVDLDDACFEYIRSKATGRVERVTHVADPHAFSSQEERHTYVLSLLDKYKRAKCVVTNRLHATLPSLAFETPVLLVGNMEFDPRFTGLLELVRHCTREELLSGHANFDFASPTENSKAYLPIREALQKTVRKWVQENSVKVR